MFGEHKDSGKPRMDLLPPHALIAVARVMSDGAKKYTSYGECDCYVQDAIKIANIKPKDFVILVTQSNSSRNTENGTTHTSNNIVNNILKELNRSIENLVENQKMWFEKNSMTYDECMESQMKNWLVCLRKQFVQFAVKAQTSALTTTTQPDKCETDFVEVATLLLASLKNMSGLLKHSLTCKSGTTVKSGADNYRNGIRHRGLYASALRHMNAWLAGENTDAESGSNPLHHAAADLLMLVQMQHDHPELDDRFKVTKETENEVKADSGDSSIRSIVDRVLRRAGIDESGNCIDGSDAFIPNYGC